MVETKFGLRRQHHEAVYTRCQIAALQLKMGTAFVALQVVIDDLGVEDVDEFEAELAAVNNAKSA